MHANALGVLEKLSPTSYPVTQKLDQVHDWWKGGAVGKWQPGLCGACRHAELQAHPRGAQPYLLCGWSRRDSRWPRYPSLPVHECAVFAPAQAAKHDACAKEAFRSAPSDDDNE